MIRQLVDSGSSNEAPTISWPAWDADTLTMSFGSEPAAVDRDEGGVRERGFAHGATARVVVGGRMKPAVDAGPTVEMAAESDHWIGNEVEADVAIKAGVCRQSVCGAAAGDFLCRGLLLR